MRVSAPVAQVASRDLVHRFEAAQRAADMLITGYVTDTETVARELFEVLRTPAVLYRCFNPPRPPLTPLTMPRREWYVCMCLPGLYLVDCTCETPIATALALNIHQA